MTLVLVLTVFFEAMIFPRAALAVAACPSFSLCAATGFIRQILEKAILLLIGFAVVFFIYGITKYITAGEDEERRKKMKNLIIYGIIGLFVMVSFWGIVSVLMDTFGFYGGSFGIKTPYFDGGGTSGSGSGSGSGGSFEYGGRVP